MGLLDNLTQEDYYNGSDFGNYQFISLDDIINNFMIAYVGEDNLIPKVKMPIVAFHAQRALAELSFDTFKSVKSQEIELPSSLTMTLPHDYVNYVKLSWMDSAGIEHIIYPTSKTSNPKAIDQNTDGSYKSFTEMITYPDLTTSWAHGSSNITQDTSAGTITFPADDTYSSVILPTLTKGNKYEITVTVDSIAAGVNVFLSNEPTTNADKLTYPNNGLNNWYNPITSTTGTHSIEFIANKTSVQLYSSPYSGAVVLSSVKLVSTDLEYQSESNTWEKYKDNTPAENQEKYDDDYYVTALGQRYGLEPSHAQVNGSYYIDDNTGKIHFSSNLKGETIILKYISDSLGTDGEMQVHKMAEEAMYKWIAYGILSTRVGIPDNVIMRLRRDRTAETRKAKLRLSNIKLEEITQTLRNMSKHIKH